MTNPSASHEDQQKALRTLGDLRAGRIAEVNLYGAIIELGKAQVYEAQPDIEPLLRSDSATLRSAALQVLGMYWQRDEYRQTTIDMVQHDQDEQVRNLAASIVGTYYRNTNDLDILHLLATVVADTNEDYIVRRTAYAAMRSIVAYDPQEFMRIRMRLRTQSDLENDVDWAFVNQHVHGQAG
jgi:hypothetical protein